MPSFTPAKISRKRGTMPDLGKAYVQIVPSAKGMSGNIKKELEGSGAESGEGFGAKFASMAKKLIVGAAIGKVVKDSLTAGGDLQQSFGGLETLYGEAAESAKKYAMEAQKAGISANNYAEQAVSFGAGLKAAFGGDTTKAMEAANTAILDMADNAAKMGTPIENIQNAYQGFAKQNYTMLDNLKLGYGGTKSEMERLLKDAEKISGVKYDMSNLGDVYDAIHVIQGELGLTGVAAEEAKTTFTGSLGAMKAAATNLLAAFSTGMDITEPLKALVENAKNFLIGNLLPMIGNIVKQIPTLLQESQSIGQDLIKNIVSSITTNAPQLVKSGADLLVQLIQGMVSNAALLLQGGIQIITALVDAMAQVDWLQVGTDILNALKGGLQQASAAIFGENNTLDDFIASLNAKLPEVLDFGIEIITNLVNGILDAAPTVISSAGEVLLSFAKGIIDALPTILEKGGELISKLLEGISSRLPDIGTKAGEIIGKFTSYLLQHFPEILQKGFELVGTLVSGIIKAIPKVIEAIWNLNKSFIAELQKLDLKEVAQDILAGLAQGLVNAWEKVKAAAKKICDKVINAFKDFFGIHSPSTKMIEIAKDLIQGLINGIKNMVSQAAAAMLGLAKTLLDKVDLSGWVEKGKELGGKLKEGLESCKDTIGNAANALATGAKTYIETGSFKSVGEAMGNAMKEGINSSAMGVKTAMQNMVDDLKLKAQQAANQMKAIEYAQTHAHLNGSVTMYGAAGDDTLGTESEEDVIIELLEKYLPVIASKGNGYDQLNREFGWGIS